MPIAAVPNYLTEADFANASPALRFGMYLRLWGINCRTRALLWTTYDIDYEVRRQQQQEVKKENKRGALAYACNLTPQDKTVMAALLERQKTLSGALKESCVLVLEAQSVAPFATGLGNEHPLENGFAFLNPYGLPYLPGSGVKGVVRRAAQELASGDWGEKNGWSHEKRYPLRKEEGEESAPLDKNHKPVVLSMLDVLFGMESDDSDTVHVQGALRFWDVIPRIAGDRLQVEIMTPHQKHYYQDGCSPHESGQLNPICFLTVPPKSGFAFYVVCDLGHLGRLAPDLAENNSWKTLLRAAFAHAFDWLGFGAKTAVGYGAMRQDRQADAAGETRPDLEMVWENATVSYNVSTRIMEAKAPANEQGKPKIARLDNAKALFDALGSRKRQDKAKSGLLQTPVKVRPKKDGGWELLTVLPQDQTQG